MNLRSISVLSGAALLSFAWSSSRSQVAEPSQLPVGSTIRVTLVKGIDARKNKAGDNVIARTTENVKSEGHALIPSGSQIIGRVSEAKARSKVEPESTLGIIFDQAVLKGGRAIPLALTIQAIAPPKPEHSDPSDLPQIRAATAGGVAGTNSGPVSDPNAGVPGRVESPNSVYGPNGGLGGRAYSELSWSAGNRRRGTQSRKHKFIQRIIDYFAEAQRAPGRQDANNAARA